MESNVKISKPDFSYNPSDIFNDTATKSKIYRHLIDINDVISEDDIRNIKVSIADLTDLSAFKKEEDNSRQRTITPWDTLDANA